MSYPATTRPRGIRLFATAVAVVVVAALTLGPRAIIAPARGVFLQATESLASPLFALFPNADTDQVLNALLFVPLGGTLALLLPLRFWWTAVVAGLALSATVEYFQSSIPGRVPDADDVLWNTVGAAVGVVVVTVPRLIVAATRHTRGTRRGTPPGSGKRD
jgi:hypothetical protein